VHSLAGNAGSPLQGLQLWGHGVEGQQEAVHSLAQNAGMPLQWVAFTEGSAPKHARGGVQGLLSTHEGAAVCVWYVAKLASLTLTTYHTTHMLWYVGGP